MEDIKCWQLKFGSCCYSERLLNKVYSLNKLVKQKVDILELKKSIYYACKYHGSQIRQSGEPYYSHPIEVAYMLAEYTAVEAPQYYRTDMLVTAVLHDTIEDTKLTEEMILDIFGRTVAGQVEDLTRVKSYGKISSAEILDLLFKERKDDVLIIKLFDRLHNIRTIGSKSTEKAKKIINETLKHFLALSEVLELPNLCDVLYDECYKNNIKLGTVQSNISIFDQPFDL